MKNLNWSLALLLRSSSIVLLCSSSSVQVLVIGIMKEWTAPWWCFQRLSLFIWQLLLWTVSLMRFFFLLFLCKKVVRIRLLKLERLVTKYSRIKILTRWQCNDGLHDSFQRYFALFYEQLLKNQCEKIVYQEIQESSQVWKHDIGID